jgi:LmbE family N-acetylglucosaminyl deacetylase
VTGRLIVSPHLDDAVLSCWHALASAPEPATVVTLFAGVPDAATELSRWDRASGATDPSAQMRLRRREDEAALSACGARFVHCAFLDDQYRGWARPRRALVDRLVELVEDADEVWIPAGFGGHPDHVLAADAALAATVGRRRMLYADLPYATRGPAALQGADPIPSKGRGRLRETVRSALVASPYAPGHPPLSHRLSGPEQQAKRRCLGEYHSQLPVLAGRFAEWWQEPDVFGWEWWWPLDGDGSSRRAVANASVIPHWWVRRLRQRWGQGFSGARRRRRSAPQAGQSGPASSAGLPTPPGGTVFPILPASAS